MEFIFDLLQQLGSAGIQLLGQPYYYIGILFVALLYRRQIYLERKMFHTKLHSFIDQTWRTLLVAILAGFVCSLGLLIFGAVIQADVILWIWIIALLLILFRARFFCFAYSIGVIGILHSIVTYVSIETNIVLVDRLIEMMQQIHLSSLLALVAMMHLAEAVLIRVQSSKFASPVVLEGKRGKLVGGYQIHGFWPIPLFLMVPVESGTGLSLPWTPLMGGDVWGYGWMLLAFPMVIGFTEWTKASLPKAKTRRSSSLILMYSLLIMGLAIAIEQWSWPVLMLSASLLCILLHEAIGWIGSWLDNQKGELFVHNNSGLFVLGTISGSPAEEIGIEAGEIIRQVNGMKVTTREELHQAFNINSAFCKLEVLNLEGNSKFVKRAIFSGDHHQLGLILAPDHKTEFFIERKQKSILSYINLQSTCVAKRKTL